MSPNVGFVYLWRDNKNNKYYLGSHLGTLDDGYTGSNLHFYNAQKKRPQDFSRKILEYVSDRNQILVREEVWLSLIKDEELGKRYYNLKKVAAGGNIVSRLSLEKKRQHAIKSGLASKKFWASITDEEFSQRQEQARINLRSVDRHSNEYRRARAKYGKDNHFTGKKHTPEAKEKMRLAKLGKRIQYG